MENSVVVVRNTIKSVLSAQGLDAPDGRPLFAYRTSPELLERLLAGPIEEDQLRTPSFSTN